MKRLFPILILSAALLSGCGILAPAAEPTSAPEPEAAFQFSRENFPAMAGSAAAQPLAEAVASVMLGETREAVSDLFDFGNTDESCRTLLSGGCGIVLGLAPSDAVDMSAAEGAAIAADGLVFMVSESNPVNDLTVEQIRDIYTGKITNWSQVGGDDEAVTAFSKNDWSGTRAAMERLVMDGRDLAAPPAAYVAGSEGVTQAVGAFDGSDGAIGYGVYQYAVAMKMAEGFKVLSVNGVAPSAETIASGAYPLVADYCAYILSSAGENSPERVLWEWLQGGEGQAFIASRGYIPAREG